MGVAITTTVLVRPSVLTAACASGVESLVAEAVMRPVVTREEGGSAAAGTGATDATGAVARMGAAGEATGTAKTEVPAPRVGDRVPKRIDRIGREEGASALRTRGRCTRVMGGGKSARFGVGEARGVPAKSGR